MTIRVKLKQYLDELSKEEKQKPITSRRYVPSLADLARAAGYSRQNFTRFAYNKADSINKKMLDISMSTLRELGFNVTFEDILEHALNETSDKPSKNGTS